MASILDNKIQKTGVSINIVLITNRILMSWLISLKQLVMISQVHKRNPLVFISRNFKFKKKRVKIMKKCPCQSLSTEASNLEEIFLKSLPKYNWGISSLIAFTRISNFCRKICRFFCLWISHYCMKLKSINLKLNSRIFSCLVYPINLKHLWTVSILSIIDNFRFNDE